jgi:hypothetical protein
MLTTSKNHKFAEVILILLAGVNIARGLFHYLSPDSGSHAVAGMDISATSGANIVYLLAAVGALQIANGLLFLYIALKQKQLVLTAMWYVLLTSSLVLLLNFVFKQPAMPVPGRFANIAEFAVAIITICLVIYFERRSAGGGQQ